MPASAPPSFVGVHLSVRDVGVALDFYRCVGLDVPEPVGGGTHAEIDLGHGLRLALSSPEVSRMYDPAGASRTVRRPPRCSSTCRRGRLWTRRTSGWSPRATPVIWRRPMRSGGVATPRSTTRTATSSASTARSNRRSAPISRQSRPRRVVTVRTVRSIVGTLPATSEKPFSSGAPRFLVADRPFAHMTPTCAPSSSESTPGTGRRCTPRSTARCARNLVRTHGNERRFAEVDLATASREIVTEALIDAWLTCRATRRSSGRGTAVLTKPADT